MKKRKIFRRVCIVLICLLVLVGIAAWKLMDLRNVAPWKHLASVVEIESSTDNSEMVQPLGWSLAILGRDDEIRMMDFHPSFEIPTANGEIDRSKLKIIPWESGIREIAESHRVVMIMESHFVSKHREMISETLPIFRKAGFSHYAAEAIHESGSSLLARGYPTFRTGYYVSDPQFGNSVRRAIELGYEVFGYDYRPFSHEARENYAADQLAKVVEASPNSKLIVHAGLAHVLKHETEFGQRWLASLFWERTNIEPFTIWQWSDLHDAHEYRAVAKAINELVEFNEPVLLMPPPHDNLLQNVPKVDAILVHPADQSRAPDHRTPLFPAHMQNISGRWEAKQWPVVVAALKRGEPADAVPLDQVMLRNEEDSFSLWIPDSADFEIVVYNKVGVLESRHEFVDGEIIVKPK